jgi:hypothetical protein
MAEWVKIAALLIGLPVYLYVIVRILSSAVARSIYEVKQEFEKT